MKIKIIDLCLHSLIQFELILTTIWGFESILIMKNLYLYQVIWIDLNHKKFILVSNDLNWFVSIWIMKDLNLYQVEITTKTFIMFKNYFRNDSMNRVNYFIIHYSNPVYLICIFDQGLKGKQFINVFIKFFRCT